jgi:phage/plasmid-like protein (TIGR03299 family)
MSHELVAVNGIYEFAYLQSDGLPWHGLGQAVEDDQPIEVWGEKSNMFNWKINAAPALFYDAAGDEIHQFNDNVILFRDDTKLPLANVSSKYNVVQPREVLEFFDNLIKEMGFKMATAGVLFGGKRYWAQADIGESVTIMGNDKIDGKLLVGTSCDGTMKTIIKRVNTRVVCNNTWTCAMGEGVTEEVRISHGAKFDAAQVKEMMGIEKNKMDDLGLLATEMAKYKLAEDKALEYLAAAMRVEVDDDADDMEDVLKNRTLQKVFNLYNGQAIGSNVAPDTLWQAFNAVTEYCDHRRETRTIDSRVDSTHFGQLARIKKNAWAQAAELIAA